MKTVVLTCLSCVLLAGVYFILTTKSVIGSPLSVNQSINAAPNASDTAKKDSTSNTLNDSHWLDDADFQKAVEADLMSENNENSQPATNEATVPQKKVTEKKPDAPKQRKEEPAVEQSLIRQLILELDPDTTTMKKVPVEVV
jgi:hypothetical protein